MSTLFERYFPVDEQEDERVQAEWQKMVSDMESIVKASGYQSLKKRLQALIFAQDIRPGSEQDMLYQIGLKDGLRGFYDLLSSIEEELKQDIASRTV